LADVEARISALGAIKPLPLVEAQVAQREFDRRCLVSKACTEPLPPRWTRRG
jgi:hypothetical protein